MISMICILCGIRRIEIYNYITLLVAGMVEGHEQKDSRSAVANGCCLCCCSTTSRHREGENWPLFEVNHLKKHGLVSRNSLDLYMVSKMRDACLLGYPNSFFLCFANGGASPKV